MRKAAVHLFCLSTPSGNQLSDNYVSFIEFQYRCPKISTGRQCIGFDFEFQVLIGHVITITSVSKSFRTGRFLSL